jgi:hypothetical protein
MDLRNAAVMNKIMLCPCPEWPASRTSPKLRTPDGNISQTLVGCINGLTCRNVDGRKSGIAAVIVIPEGKGVWPRVIRRAKGFAPMSAVSYNAARVEGAS